MTVVFSELVIIKLHNWWMGDRLLSQVSLLMRLGEDTGVTLISAQGTLGESPNSYPLGHHYFWETHFFFTCVGK